MLYKKATLYQWLPAFLAPGIGFGDNFSTDRGGRVRVGMDGSSGNQVMASGRWSFARLPVFTSCSAAQFLTGPVQFAARGWGPLPYMTKLGLFQGCKADWYNNEYKPITHNHISREIDRVPKRCEVYRI